MRKVLLAATTLVLVACGADAQNRGASTAPRTGFDSNRAWTDLERQVAFGPRPSGSRQLDACREYIESQLTAAGITYREQPFDAMTPAGVIRMTNVIGTIAGRRPERIALATHYDTKRFSEFAFLGASDAASSTAAVLELARVLKNRQNEFTIELLFLDGEEAVNREWRDPDNTYGSKHYVQTAQRAGTLAGVKALVLLDMVGDRDLDIRPDSNSAPWLNAIVWSSAGRLGYGSTFVPDGFTVEDDHLAFVAAGVPLDRHQRSRLSAVAHGAGRSRSRQRAQPANRRRRGARRLAANRTAAPGALTISRRRGPRRAIARTPA